MSKHTIEVSKHDTYGFTHNIASCIGMGENKRLSVVVVGLDAHYEVWSGSEFVIGTKDLQAAVSAYNVPNAEVNGGAAAER